MNMLASAARRIASTPATSWRRAAAAAGANSTPATRDRIAFRLFSDEPGSDPAFAPKRRAGVDEAMSSDIDAMLQGLVDDAQEKKRPLLFMKGTPSQPQCGFSYQVVRVLHAEGAEFDAVNVLEDAAIREGVKSFSEWPTIPQLYVDGEFLGGCDVVTNLHQEGELKAILSEAGCISE